MKPWYASGARALLETRQRGAAPAGPVVVSLIGGQFGDCADTTLHVRSDDPIERLDWRMLVNLEVWIWADASIPLERVLMLADRIARVRPKRLCLRFNRPFRFEAANGIESIDTHDLDVGAGYHSPADVPALHSFFWAPTAHRNTPIEQQLHRALAATHTPGTLL